MFLAFSLLDTAASVVVTAASGVSVYRLRRLYVRFITPRLRGRRNRPKVEGRPALVGFSLATPR